MRKKRDFIRVEDLSTKEVLKLFKVAYRLKKDPLSRKKLLRYRTAALLFQKPSNRTRISFEVAAANLGAHVIYLSPEEIAMGKREPVKDVARVISRYADLIVARVFSHEDIEMLAKYSDVPVINGLSDLEHPCQALADIFTIREKMGRTRGVNLAYVGDGNKVLNSLMMACAMTGMNISAAVPEGYSPPAAIVEKAAEAAEKRSSWVHLVHDPEEAVDGADVVYTDVWTSMGYEEQKEKRLNDFRAFQVNSRLMRRASEGAYVMHCLPAHRGEEVTGDVIDGKNSIIYDQAENRMHVQKALMVSLFS